MATFDGRPGVLSAKAARADGISMTIDFDTSLAGYSLESVVLSAVSGTQVATMTATLVDGGAGIVGVSLSREQTSALPVGTYNWTLAWTTPGNVHRTAFAGTVELIA